MTRVLVTGGSGFVGRHLVAALRRRGSQVLAPSRAQWDITAGEIPDWDVEHVFHLAGATGVENSWKDPALFHLLNAHGTAVVAEFCRRRAASVTYVSAYCYGIPDRLPIRESDPVRPNNPYAFSKRQGELVCEFYHRYFGVPLTIVRPFNVYGPGQSDGFLLSRIVGEALDPTRPVIEVMDLQPRRDFVFVEDLVEALCLTAGKPGYSVYNVGSGTSRSVEEVIHAVLTAIGIAKSYRSRNVSRSNEIGDVVADVTAIRDALQWEPRTAFEEGVRRLVKDGRSS